MRILRGYVTRHLIASWALVGAMLSILLLLVRLLDEMDRLAGGYTATKAILHVALTLPQQLLMLTPVVVLAGTLAAFARLEQSNEMTVIRGSGVNKMRLLGMMGIPFLVLAVALWVTMEWVTPSLHQWGEEIRNEARGNNTLEPGESLWSRAGPTFYRVGRLGEDGTPGDIDIFVFVPEHQLTRTIHAARAEILGQRRWRLHDTVERRWEGNTVMVTHSPELTFDGLWTRDELQRLLLSLDSMSPSVLFQYKNYLDRSGQVSDTHALAFWNRVLLPLATIGMGLLALGLSAKPGSRRSGMGRQLGLGVLIGVLFYLGSQVAVALGQIFHLSALGTALFPLVCIFTAAILLVYRLRW